MINYSIVMRSAQAAVLKAIKEGKTNVDLNLPIDPDGGDDGNGGGIKGDTSTSGGNTDGGSNGDNEHITL